MCGWCLLIPWAEDLLMDGPGRPTLYKQEYAEQANKLCPGGARNDELAECFGVSCSTIDNSRLSPSSPRLFGAPAGSRMARTVHRPPHIRACTFWLRNRQPQQRTRGAPRKMTRTIGRSSSETFGKQASVPTKCGPLDDRLRSRPSRPPRRSPAPAVSPMRERAPAWRSDPAAPPASNAAGPADAHGR